MTACAASQALQSKLHKGTESLPPETFWKASNFPTDRTTNCSGATAAEPRKIIFIQQTWTPWNKDKHIKLQRVLQYLIVPPSDTCSSHIQVGKVGEGSPSGVLDRSMQIWRTEKSHASSSLNHRCNRQEKPKQHRSLKEHGETTLTCWHQHIGRSCNFAPMMHMV